MASEIAFRLITSLLLGTALSISAYFRNRAERQGGQMRTTEGRGLVVVLRLLGLAVFVPVLGYIINPEWVAWARFPLPDWARWLAAIVALAAIPMFYWILVSLGVNISPTQATRHNHTLVTHGPYRWVRHPLYTTGLIFCISLTLLTTIWWFGVAGLLPFVILLLRTSREEARLIDAFGDEYREYMKRTGRFLPRLAR